METESSSLLPWLNGFLFIIEFAPRKSKLVSMKFRVLYAPRIEEEDLSCSTVRRLYPITAKNIIREQIWILNDTSKRMARCPLLLTIFLSLWTLTSNLELETPPHDIVNSSFLVLPDGTRPDPDGDTLGVTRCYCATKYWGHDPRFGYYYLWDYYNFHTNATLKLELTCDKDTWTKLSPLVPWNYELECLRFQTNVKDCVTDPAGDKFCYIRNGMESRDIFMFNKQKRGIPTKGHRIIEPPDSVQRKCDSICHDKFGSDMEMLKGRAMDFANRFTPLTTKFSKKDNEWSHINLYLEVDDMCDGCKKR